jgi:hypothetical protein
MQKEAGSTNAELALILLGGALIFFAIIVGTYSALVHWNVH